jgi:nucleoside-diphosphate-sugar epimerase
MPRLFIFGLGYTGETLARELLADGWQVAGTSRSAEKCAELTKLGLEATVFDRSQPLDETALAGATHLLSSVPPDEAGDPVLDAAGAALARLGHIEWAAYLSTTGVYGDRAGGWVDETSELRPVGERGRRRVAAEQGWLDLGTRTGTPTHLFRLPGIYGPGRSPLDDLRAGTARRVDKPGQIFSRIHVDDIVQVLRASMARPNGGAAYNVTDDEAASSPEVIAFAAGLLGIEPPPLIPFAEAKLSPMAGSFYAESKRVRNDRIKRELGVTLRHPTYREGLRAIISRPFT